MLGRQKNHSFRGPDVRAYTLYKVVVNFFIVDSPTLNGV